MTCAFLLLLAADWPQWRGPARDGVSPEKGLLRKWPEGGPKLLWKSKEAGAGLAGLAVVDGVAYTLGAFGGDEYALAFDPKGKRLWRTKLGPVHADKSVNAFSVGPNSTPTVAGGHVFALTSKGLLACLTTEGKLIWKKDLPKEMNGAVSNVGWGEDTKGFGSGYCWSPVAVGDKLLIAPGGPDGLLALLEARTGKLVWRSKKVADEATYGSPAVGKVGGKEMAFYVVQSGFVAVSMEDGSLVYRHKRDEDYPDVVCDTPRVAGDAVMTSVGYGGGSAERYEWDGKSFVRKWEGKKEIGSRQGGTVLVGKHLFGFHDDQQWMCQDAATGAVAWPKKREERSLKAGTIIAADGLLFILDETGKAGLVEASAEKYVPLGEFALPEKGKRPTSGKAWTHPSLSGGRLFLRDQQWVFCYAVK
ncbi:MAG: PQQ-like beta-propeller repeat protein [Gemmataceae bacterium]|nr:PQQ-like beta-propeller repeat protein [Gemmataceae bacterium]